MRPNSTFSPQPHKPLIVKYVQPSPSGIVAQTISRHAIGCVMHGRKRIYSGDSYCEVRAGELFYLDIGTHHVELLPDDRHPFEQITCFYSPERLNETILMLGGDMEIEPSSQKPDHTTSAECIVCPAWDTARSLFAGINLYLRRGGDLSGEHIVGRIKTTELLYLIMDNPQCPIRERLLSGMDLAAHSFEQTVRAHIFDPLSVGQLAELCHCSPTSFKRRFHDTFGVPPRRWFTVQRLSRAKLLLFSTTKPVAEIGTECMFANPSHFIRQFRQEFGMTPSAYRAKHDNK